MPLKISLSTSSSLNILCRPFTNQNWFHRLLIKFSHFHIVEFKVVEFFLGFCVKKLLRSCGNLTSKTTSLLLNLANTSVKVSFMYDFFNDVGDLLL